MCRRRFLTLWLLLLGMVPAPALAGAKTAPAPKGTKPPPPKGLDAKGLVEELRKLVDLPPLRRAHFGVSVADLATGEWLFEHNPDEPLTVASNNKLVTTAAALELLGLDFEFKTTVSAVGHVQGGVLEGDLVIVGGGDPSISGRFHEGKSTAILEQWADAVVKAGIKTVRGGIIADDTYFDRQYTHPLWPSGQYQAWYCAEVSGLAFNDDCALVVVKPAADSGAPAAATTDPPTSYLRLVNTCGTSRARVGGNQVLVRRRAGGNTITVSGEIRAQGAPFVTWITVHEPPLYCATVFREVLASKGVSVGGPARLLGPPLRLDPAKTTEIVTTTSPLKDAVVVANRNSQNFYAEQMLKTIGREKTGKGTWADGAAAVAKFLKDAGVTGAVAYTDGSGLSRTNRFSTRQIAQLLKYMNGRRSGNAYMHSMAEPGEGTLSKRLAALDDRVFAKTGYIAGVSALSGYVETKGKRLLAFSILVNDFRCGLGDVRNFQDAVCLMLGDYEP